MADKIQIRRDTAANWTSANPTLAQGELGYETDTDKVKVGDGSTAWTSLGYVIDTGGYLTSSNNLSDLASAATSRTNLGLGTAATTASTDYATAAQGALADSALQSSDIANMLETTDIGVSVQAYDADTLKADVADTITASMRGTVTTDNDLSFDMNATNNFSCTPSGTGTLTFTNITAGQSGNIYLDNSGGHVISAAATTFISAADLTKISTAGKYFVSYYSADGTNVLVSASSAVTASGA
jgi:hypothetical protein